MNAKIDDVMVQSVMTTTPHQTVGHVRDVMNRHQISSMPVLGPEGEPVGIVTATDVLACKAEGRRVSQIMSKSVYTVPQYADPSLAARLMRNHRIHHLVVTHEKKVVGILSAFDLLQLVEDHRFTMKNAPTRTKRGGARKKGAEGEPA